MHVCVYVLGVCLKLIFLHVDFERPREHETFRKKMIRQKSGNSFNKPGSETQEEVGLDLELGSLRAVVDAVTQML